ncbi:MAG: PEP-CTERM sorting domain-containing protein [Desulfobulbaceae bacterium]|nr:PEP-CTERM sorting domain-containing protein [Desulfobulbaceae bacterium]
MLILRWRMVSFRTFCEIVNFESGVALVLGDTATVHATVTNLGGASFPVPEPATLLLFGAGLAGLAAKLRSES